MKTVKSVNPTKYAWALIAVVLSVLSLFSPLATAQAASPADYSEYQQFVHTYVNSPLGNYTTVGKPMFPVFFNDSQIAIGASWSVTEPLVAGHNYHVYCYGDWVNNGAIPKTDYDIYVYNPAGKLESEHTEAAGLPEHLGTRVDDTFFTPQQTGNYRFVIVNDGAQSRGAQPATFMIIENVEVNQWQTIYIEGKQANGLPTKDTTWAYEFVTDAPEVRIYVDVPNTLDIYEARLYVMSKDDSLIVNDAPLPWEQGLYGNLTGNVGGYNLDSSAYRGVAYASCEYKGQDMQLYYNHTRTGKTLYHLALIGETGAGNVKFLIKTQMDSATLTAVKTPGASAPTNATTISYATNGTNIQTATLKYTTDNWETTQQTEVTIKNQTCTAIIPKQAAGTQVQYQLTATDLLMNTLQAKGNYTVKQVVTLNVTVNSETIYIGQNLTVNGILKGITKGTVNIQLMNAQTTLEDKAEIRSNGTFTIQLSPNITGQWALQASFDGDKSTLSAFASQINITVEEPPFYVKNGVFIGGGGFFGVAALLLAYYVKKRRQQ